MTPRDSNTPATVRLGGASGEGQTRLPATRGVMSLCLLALASCGWPNNVTCTTPSGVELSREPTPAIGCTTLEQWTQEVAGAFALSPCPEVASCDVLAVLRRGQDLGSQVQVYWRSPPLCWGRVIYADRRDRYQHELAHALIDGCCLAPWPMGGPAVEDHEHHRLMCRCLPELAGEALCERIAR
jgi:hypothetical protein